MQEYGYHAVVPALLADPGGVPWAWIFLMLLAEAADKSIALMLLYGFLLLTAVDHAFYWLGAKGGRPLMQRLQKRWPGLAGRIQGAEVAVRTKGSWAVLGGRFLPVVGRFVGLGAGLANVSPGQFILFDALGVGLTVIGFGLAAHLVGHHTINAPWFPQAVGGAFIGGIVFMLCLFGWHMIKVRRVQS
ncbi:MAG: VTT domain-containing protein [Abitibacteriaceae bacterium]|nr:VTT domain-containing protein [Abditibacteriaceae bacterium]